MATRPFSFVDLPAERSTEKPRRRGLTVFGEVGSKWDETSAETMVAPANACFAAGCEPVLIEGAELADAESRREGRRGTPSRAANCRIPWPGAPLSVNLAAAGRDRARAPGSGPTAMGERP